VIARLRRIRRECLGINRRNHDLLFRWNPRTRYHVADDKRATKAVLAAAGVPTPLLHAVCEASWEIAGLRPRLEALGRFVLKPARGAGGSGIVVVTGRADGAFVKASGDRLSWRDRAIHAADVVAGAHSPTGLDDAALVEALVVCEPGLATLAYRGVPDVRVLVFRGVPVLAMLRLPTSRSDGRANLHLGGIGVGVDLADGRTTTAIADGRPIRRHPDLDLPLADVAVPGWDDVLAVATRAGAAAGLGFVGVDVVVDAARGPLVLELNARPGLAIQIANRRGLRPALAAVAAATIPDDVAGRVALGRRLAAAPTSRTGS